MSSTEHALATLGTIFIAFMIGRTMGYYKGNNIGYQLGATDGIRSCFNSLEQLYGIKYSYDVEINEETDEDEE
jgi:hypothetical protein